MLPSTSRQISAGLAGRIDLAHAVVEGTENVKRRREILRGTVLQQYRERFQIVGVEINANHLRPAMTGHVTGRASPIHLGRRTQVWAIEIRDDRKRLVCVSRLTIAVIERERR